MLDSTLNEGILELRLARPPVNALDPALVSALHRAITGAAAEGAKGIVLCGAHGMFSAGLDVPTLLTLDRPAMRNFWQEFFALCAAIACSPIPVAAAITGHSPAGGAVMALLCDYRVMAHGPYKIGLNEVQVGLIVPDCLQLALRRIVGTHRAERLVVSGTMIDAERAAEIGFVDELAPVEQVTQRAYHWLRELLTLPREAMLATRALARAELADAFADLSALPVDSFLERWFSEETQTVLKALVAQLKSKR